LIIIQLIADIGKWKKRQILQVNVQNPYDRGYFVQQLKCRKCQKADGGKHSLERKTPEL